LNDPKGYEWIRSRSFLETTLVFGVVWIVAWLVVEYGIARRMARKVVTGLGGELLLAAGYQDQR
jgi:hypothetical protein